MCRKYNAPPRRQNFFGLQDGAGWSALGWLSLQNGQKKSDVQLEFVPHDQLEGAVAGGTGGVEGDAGDGDEGLALAERQILGLFIGGVDQLQRLGAGAGEADVVFVRQHLDERGIVQVLLNKK